jgi:hypothetical protein
MLALMQSCKGLRDDVELKKILVHHAMAMATTPCYS